MKIGELAKKAGCKPVTVHYYEKKGLMPQAERTGANYRNYGTEDLKRLSFIRHCRKHGMNLDEIAELLSIANNPENTCARIHALLETHIKNIERQIADLEELKNSLEVIRGQCDGSQKSCAVLTSLGNMHECAYCQHMPESSNGSSLDTAISESKASGRF